MKLLSIVDRRARRVARPLLSPWVLGLSAVLTACGSTPPQVLLTLPPAHTSIAAPAPAPTTSNLTAGTRAAGLALPVLALRRVEVPEYVVSRRVRYRADASTVVEWPDTYWAERIEIGVSREFASALQQQLPGWRLCEGACAEQSPALSLQVDFSQLDYMRSERRLQARVRLLVWGTDGAPQLRRSEDRNHTIATVADTPQAQASATTELLQRVAAEAAAMVAASR